MSIEIKFTKLIEAGQPKVKIDKVKALKLIDLPNDYIHKGNHCFLSIDKGATFTKNTIVVDDKKDRTLVYLREGDIIEAEYFYYTLKLIKKCGKRLMKVNKKLKKENKNWNEGKTQKIKI